MKVRFVLLLFGLIWLVYVLALVALADVRLIAKYAPSDVTIPGIPANRQIGQQYGDCRYENGYPPNYRYHSCSVDNVVIYTTDNQITTISVFCYSSGLNAGALIESWGDS
jgi:putative cell wall-binding protein